MIVSIEDDVVSDIVRRRLIEDHHICKQLGDDPRDIKLLRKAIKYYSTPDQWDTWKVSEHYD